MGKNAVCATGTAIQSVNDTGLKIALCSLDTDIPTTPSGGELGVNYFLSRDAFERMGPSLVNKPLRMTFPAGDHVNPDGTSGEAIGVVTGFGVEENPDGLPEGTFATVDVLVWEKDKPLETAALMENKDEWGTSWELCNEDPDVGLTVTEDADGARIYLGSDENPCVFEGVAALPRTDAAYRQFTKILASKGKLDGVYSGPDDEALPDDIKEKPGHLRKMFVSIFNSAFADWAPDKDQEYDENKSAMENREAYAFRIARARVAKSEENRAASTNDDKEAQEKRAADYGIGVRDDGSVTQPSADKAAGLTEADYADPVNYKFPVWLTESKDGISEERLNQVRNAPARFAQFGDRYDSQSRAVVRERIVDALKKFGLGPFRAAATSAFAKRLDEIEEGNPTEEGGTNVSEDQRIQELESQLTQLQAQIASQKEGLQAAEASLAEVVQVRTTSGIDDPLALSDMIAAAGKVRELLCSVLAEEHAGAPLDELAQTVLDEVKAAREAVAQAELDRAATEHFATLKDKYSEDTHEEVKAACLQLAAGKDVLANMKKLEDLRPSSVPGGPDGDPAPNPRANSNSGGAEKEKEAVVSAMLRACGQEPDA